MLLKPTLIEFNVLISVPVDHVKLHVLTEIFTRN